MRLLDDCIRKVTPYTPGEQPKDEDVIKLNTNECPYPPSGAVKRAIQNTDVSKQRLYPDPLASELVEALAKYHGVDKDMVFAGVGSDDVLAMAFLTFFNTKIPILFPDITYSFYDVWAGLFGIPYENVPLGEGFILEEGGYKKENGGIVFPNPNAPTAIAAPLSVVELVVSQNPSSVVIVDEAYIDFGGESALSLIKKYDNLLVVRTFSKSRSLAGMRIGYAIGNHYLIEAMKNVKFSYNSYTLNRVSIEAGAASIGDDQYFKDTVKKVVEVREEAKSKLLNMGFELTESSTNFLFASHKKMYAGDIFEALKDRKIYVRHFNQERIDNYLRITIGTKEEMEHLYDALYDILR